MAETAAGGPASGGTRPEDFLTAFDDLRARCSPRQVRTFRRVRRTVERRQPEKSGERAYLQWIDAPPPILDLELGQQNEERSRRWRGPLRGRYEHRPVADPPGQAEQARRWLDHLRGRCRHQPVADLPGRSGGEDREPVSTERLYQLIEQLKKDFADLAQDAGGPPAPAEPNRWKRFSLRWRWKRYPSPARFRRVESLLELSRVDPGDITRRIERKKPSTDEPAAGSSRLHPERVTQIHVAEAVREVSREMRSKRERTPQQAGTANADSRLRKAKNRFYQGVGLTAKFVRFDFLDRKILTPLGFLVSAGALFFMRVFGSPFLAQRFGLIEDVVTGLVASVLLVVYACVGGLLYLPWLRYAWLRHQPYRFDGVRDSTGTAEKQRESHRSRGIHLINAYRAAKEQDADESREREDFREIHRIAVNALLGDLEDAYGSMRRRHCWLPLRQRHCRPVLLVDQGALGPTGRYLVRLIERVRAIRKFPDPLLIVVVRRPGQNIAELVPPEVDPGPALDAAAKNGGKKGPTRPAAIAGVPGSDRNEVAVHPRVLEWRELQSTIGRLGPQRVLTFPKVGAPDNGDSAPAAPVPPTGRILTWNALATMALGGTAVLLLGTTLGGPATVAAVNKCVGYGDRAWGPPDGIVQAGGDCVGWTDGSFVFDERLESVQERIAEQNEAVERSGRPYATVVYVGNLSVDDPKTQSDLLAGVHGEIAGLAIRQARYNTETRMGESSPAIRLLLASTGPGWRHTSETAESVLDLARTDDTFLAAVGFGTSVTPNNEIIREFTRAAVPMVGTTPTYDDIAEVGPGTNSDYFFPLAPSNTRLARQAAHWGFHGARQDASGGDPLELEPARSAVALADDSELESYGMDLAESFMDEFTELGGEDAKDGVLPFGSEHPTLRQRVAEICADPPDLVYYAGRSDDFAAFYGRIQEQGTCSGGVTVLGGDDIAKYVTDHVHELGHTEGFPVYYTPLAASGTWGLNAELDEHRFYADLARLEEELGLSDEPDALRPSTAHAVMAHDGLMAIGTALIDARDSQYGQSDGWDTPASLEQELRDLDDAIGVSGQLGFGAERSGHWYDEKLVQLVLAGPEDTQHVIAACGRLNPEEEAPGPNCR